MKGDVVHILGVNNFGEESEVGMGFFFTDNLIFTCAHNLLSGLHDKSYSEEIKIRILKDENLYKAIRIDSCFSPKEEGDFALFEVQDPPVDVLPFQLRTFFNLGDAEVCLYGKSNDTQEFQLKEGIVRNYESQTKRLKYELLQIEEAELYPGFSGSPLVIKGTNQVIGMYLGKYSTEFEESFHALSSRSLIDEISSCGLSYPSYLHFEPITLLNSNNKGYSDWKFYKSDQLGTFSEGVYPSMYVGLNRKKLIEFIFGDFSQVWKMLVHTEQIILDAQFRNFFENKKVVKSLQSKIWLCIDEEQIKEIVQQNFTTFFQRQKEFNACVDDIVMSKLLRALDENSINGIFDPSNNFNCNLGICVFIENELSLQRWRDIHHIIKSNPFLEQFSYIFCSNHINNKKLVAKNSILSQHKLDISKLTGRQSGNGLRSLTDEHVRTTRENLLQSLDEELVVDITLFLIIVKKEKRCHSDHFLRDNCPNLVWLISELSIAKKDSILESQQTYDGQSIERIVQILFGHIKKLRFSVNPNINLIHLIKKEILGNEIPFLIINYFTEYKSELISAYFSNDVKGGRKNLLSFEESDLDTSKDEDEIHRRSKNEDSKELIQSLLMYAMACNDFEIIESWITRALAENRLIELWPMESQRQLKEDLLLVLIKYSNRQKNEVNPQIIELLKKEFYINFGSSEQDSLRHQSVSQLRSYVLDCRGDISKTQQWLLSFFEQFMDFRFLLMEVEVPMNNILLLVRIPEWKENYSFWRTAFNAPISTDKIQSLLKLSSNERAIFGLTTEEEKKRIDADVLLNEFIMKCRFN